MSSQALHKDQLYMAPNGCCLKSFLPPVLFICGKSMRVWDHSLVAINLGSKLKTIRIINRWKIEKKKCLLLIYN